MANLAPVHSATCFAFTSLIRVFMQALSPGSYASVKWFELPAGYVFHVGNCFEEDEGNTVRIYACHLDEFSFASMDGSGPFPDSRLYEYTLDVPSGTAKSRKVS